MEHTVDARGLSCPLPLVKARAALARLGAGDTLVVLATDPEAPIDLAALAADHGLRLTSGRAADHWRLVLSRLVMARPGRSAGTQHPAAR